MRHSHQIKFLAFAAVTLVLLSSAVKMNFRSERLHAVVSDASDKLPAKPNTAFKEGEVLTYKLHYGIIDAGVAVLEVKPQLLKVKGRSVYHIVGTGYTTGTTDWFFKVRDRYETFMDKDALLPWLFIRQV